MQMMGAAGRVQARTRAQSMPIAPSDAAGHLVVGGGTAVGRRATQTRAGRRATRTGHVMSAALPDCAFGRFCGPSQVGEVV